MEKRGNRPAPSNRQTVNVLQGWMYSDQGKIQCYEKIYYDDNIIVFYTSQRGALRIHLNTCFKIVVNSD